MTFRHAFASALHAFVILAFFSVGLFFALLPYLPEARERVVDFLGNSPDACRGIGLWIFGATFVLLIGFYALNRGRYLRIEMGGNAVEIDIQVVHETVEDRLLFEFPKLVSLDEVEIILGKRIEIKVEIAPQDDDKSRDQLYKRVEASLQTLLEERFGYTKTFHLIVKD